MNSTEKQQNQLGNQAMWFSRVMDQITIREILIAFVLVRVTVKIYLLMKKGMIYIPIPVIQSTPVNAPVSVNLHIALDKKCDKQKF